MKYRYERKYFLSPHTAALLRQRVAAVMQPDSHSGGTYMVNNIYLDDRYDSFLHQKTKGSLVRDKYRVRFYNQDLSFIRLERKHKEGDRTCKEGVRLTAEQYRQVKQGDFAFMLTHKEPLFQTVGVLHRLRTMRVTACFTYRREAYCFTPGHVRVTFDSHIGEDVLGVRLKADGPPVMLEVKYDGFMPHVIANLFDGAPMIHTEMSKYYFVRERESR